MSLSWKYIFLVKMFQIAWVCLKKMKRKHSVSWKCTFVFSDICFETSRLIVQGEIINWIKVCWFSGFDIVIPVAYWIFSIFILMHICTNWCVMRCLPSLERNASYFVVLFLKQNYPNRVLNEHKLRLEKLTQATAYCAVRK